MGKLLIAGAGGHGKVVADVAIAMKKWNEIAFLDDRYKELNGKQNCPVIGSLEKANQYLEEYKNIFVAIGDGPLRLKLLNQYITQGFDIPVLVQPGAWVSPSAKLGRGSVVMAQAAINADANIGIGSIINTAATVDHDCMIEEGVHICPGVHLAGEVKIGKLSWIGLGAIVKHQVNIGNQVTVGAGAVVLSDIEDGDTVAGMPAKKMEKSE